MSEENTLSNVDLKNSVIQQSASYAFGVVEELNKLSLVTPKEINILKEAQVFLLSTYTDVPAFRTYVEKYAGVLTNARFPTPDSKYWQCKKEAEVQFNELLKALLRHRASNVELEEIDYKMRDLEKKKSGSEHPFLVECDLRKFEIKMVEIQLYIKNIEKEIKYRIIEIGDWNEISKEWEPTMKHSKDIYSDHEMDSLMGYLKRELKSSSDKKDDTSTKVLSSQLESLEAFAKRRMLKLLKK